MALNVCLRAIAALWPCHPTWPCHPPANREVVCRLPLTLRGDKRFCNRRRAGKGQAAWTERGCPRRANDRPRPPATLPAGGLALRL